MPPIPWTAILTHGPAIVAAAERLLARTEPNRFAEQARSIEARLEALEKASADSARLIQEIAQQLQALVIAQELAARRMRVTTMVAGAAAALALAAGILAFVV